MVGRTNANSNLVNKTLLWSNPNTSEAMQPQTINSINHSDYNAFIVRFKESITVEKYYDCVVYKSGTQIASFKVTSAVMVLREISANADETINVGLCLVLNNGESLTNNECMIPIAIYGTNIATY